MINPITSLVKFDFPTSWRHGIGLAGQTAQFVRQLNCHHPLILTDSLLVRLKVIDPILASLDGDGIEYEVCDAVTYEPTVDLFETLTRNLDLQRFDLIIAAGGGSVIDVAKGLALVGTFGGHIRDYAGFDKVPAPPGIKTMAVPTTSGTGSEISDGVVLIDEAHDTKFLVISKKICPTMALTDPKMTLSMPPTVTAASGVDALVHATESYISKGASPVTEIFALKAVELIGHNLLGAYRNGEDIWVREQMQIGATMAMAAGMNSYLGLCHALAMPLCALYHMPHGHAVGMALRPVLAYNSVIAGTKVAHVLDHMGFSPEVNRTKAGLAEELAQLEGFLVQLGLGARLGEFGFQESHMGTIVQATLASAQRPTNPRDPSAEDIAGIVHDMV